MLFSEAGGPHDWCSVEQEPRSVDWRLYLTLHIPRHPASDGICRYTNIFMAYLRSSRAQLAELKKKWLSVFFSTCNTAFHREKPIFSVPSARAGTSPNIESFVCLICGERKETLPVSHTQCKLSFVFADGGFWKGIFKNLTPVNEKSLSMYDFHAGARHACRNKVPGIRISGFLQFLSSLE